MSNQRTNPVIILALNDVRLIVFLAYTVAWHFADHFLTLPWQLACLCLVVILQFIWRRRLEAYSRLARRAVCRMSRTERRQRWHWVSALYVLMAVGIAWAIPLGFNTAGFWCLYITALVVLICLHESAKEELLHDA